VWAGVGRDAVTSLEMRSAGRVQVLRAVRWAPGTELAYKENAPSGFHKGPWRVLRRTTAHAHVVLNLLSRCPPLSAPCPDPARGAPEAAPKLVQSLQRHRR
jgi:hypothetical protein